VVQQELVIKFCYLLAQVLIVVVIWLALIQVQPASAFQMSSDWQKADNSLNIALCRIKKKFKFVNSIFTELKICIDF